MGKRSEVADVEVEVGMELLGAAWVSLEIGMRESESVVGKISDVEVGITGDTSVELGVSMLIKEKVSLGKMSEDDAVDSAKVSEGTSDTEVLVGISLAESVEET